MGKKNSLESVSLTRHKVLILIEFISCTLIHNVTTTTSERCTEKIALSTGLLHFHCYSYGSFRYGERVLWAHDRCSVLSTESFCKYDKKKCRSPVNRRSGSTFSIECFFFCVFFACGKIILENSEPSITYVMLTSINLSNIGLETDFQRMPDKM